MEACDHVELMQAEALRGDPEGYARQQTVLDTAQKLVTRAQAQVAAMEANTPSLEQVSLSAANKSTPLMHGLVAYSSRVVGRMQ